jgi:hypothetical protein
MMPLKNSLFALLSVAFFVVSSQAVTFTTIDTAGTHDIPSGEYDDGSSYFGINASAKDLTVNVEDGIGTLKFGTSAAPITTRPAWFLNADDNGGGTAGHIVFNGNLEIFGKRTNSAAWTPIMANYSGSAITVNGNISAKFDKEIASGNGGTYMFFIIDDAYFTLNGDLDLQGVSSTGSGYAYAWGIVADSNVTSGQAPLPAVIELGSNANHIIDIHDISASGTTDADAIGIIGFGYNNTNFANPGEYLINVNGKAYLTNIHAETAGGGQALALAAGAYAVYKGAINFLADTYINNITASGADSQAWALYAEESGVINVNPNSNADNIIQIKGNIGAADGDGSFPGARVNVNLSNADSYFLGETASNGTASVNINLSNGAQWRTRDNFAIDKLNVNGGVIDAAWQLHTGLETPEFQNVSITDLIGTNPHFVVKTDFTNMQSDIIDVANGYAGASSLKVWDVNMEAGDKYSSTNGELLVVKSSNGQLSQFTPLETNGLFFKYTPLIRQTANAVYVTGFGDKQALAPAYYGQVVVQAAYRNQLSISNYIFDHIYIDSEVYSASRYSSEKEDEGGYSFRINIVRKM